MAVKRAAPKKPVASKTQSKPAARTKPAVAKPSLTETMAALEKAGTAQTRKTYLRHGAKEPMFGVSFATLKVLLKKIGVDHELACALWATGNFDARNLAVKIADPAKMTEPDLDRWARADYPSMCSPYVAALASESAHGMSRARAWLASRDANERATGWTLVGTLAMCDETTPDAWFLARIGDIEQKVHEAPNAERVNLNRALISIGCRSAALRKAAESAAKRIGPVAVDHGDTACKTPDAKEYIAKAWTHSVSKGFDSPAAHERSRESMRLRC